MTNKQSGKKTRPLLIEPVQKGFCATTALAAVERKMKKRANLSPLFPSFAPPGQARRWHSDLKSARKPFLNTVRLSDERMTDVILMLRGRNVSVNVDLPRLTPLAHPDKHRPIGFNVQEAPGMYRSDATAKPQATTGDGPC